MKEEVTDRLGTINDAYQQRVDGLAAAHEIKNEEAEKAREDSGIVSVDTPFSESAESQAIAADEEAADESGEDEPTPSPDMSWKKDDIIDYIVESDVDDELERADLEVMTKTELIDRFIDNEG